MALSQEEQRMLSEIERRLSAEDPGLAARMASLRRPGLGSVFRSTRARIIGSLVTVAIVGMISLMVYAMLPFRSHGARPVGSRPAASFRQPVMTVSSGHASAKGSGGRGSSGSAAPSKQAARTAGAPQAARTRPAAGAGASSSSVHAP